MWQNTKMFWQVVQSGIVEKRLPNKHNRSQRASDGFNDETSTTTELNPLVGDGVYVFLSGCPFAITLLRVRSVDHHRVRRLCSVRKKTLKAQTLLACSVADCNKPLSNVRTRLWPPSCPLGHMSACAAHVARCGPIRRALH